MAVARDMAMRSLCPNGPGCVIVDEYNVPIICAYAGPDFTISTTGRESCFTICPRSAKPGGVPKDSQYLDCISIHAEQNALILGDSTRMRGGTAYVSRRPCYTCMKMLKNVRLDKVRWPEATLIFTGTKYVEISY
jgi:deoxycytidylate deaminase